MRNIKSGLSSISLIASRKKKTISHLSIKNGKEKIILKYNLYIIYIKEKKMKKIIIICLIMMVAITSVFAYATVGVTLGANARTIKMEGDIYPGYRMTATEEAVGFDVAIYGECSITEMTYLRSILNFTVYDKTATVTPLVNTTQGDQFVTDTLVGFTFGWKQKIDETFELYEGLGLYLGGGQYAATPDIGEAYTQESNFNFGGIIEVGCYFHLNDGWSAVLGVDSRLMFVGSGIPYDELDGADSVLDTRSKVSFGIAYQYE